MLRKIRKLLKKQEGFTLVELMIVVVILGILAGIGVQQYGNIQERAREAADAANRKVLTNAANMWLIMNGGFPGENEATKTFEGEKNDLVPVYVDEWPMNPYSNERDYVVTITKTVEKKDDGSESERYSIVVTPE
ncbi:MAG TPA: prepilin-type N-terminal cleavage/methylation domain-containing protein [Limnochordia bacterium]|nr:prepilin-type N-terminal cleavage/methylation domain-containing protein [Limnochordia bacterium]